jgi:hypothetical protein
MGLSPSKFCVTLIPIIAFILYAVLQVGWLAADERPAVEQRDFARVVHWGHVLRGDALGAVYPVTGDHVRHSPFLTVWTAPFLALFGCRLDVAVLSLLPFAALLMLAVYGIARRYVSSTAASIASLLALAFHHFAVVEPLYPAYAFLKEYKADFPLSALVAATFWGMLGLRDCASRRRIAAVALIAAVGMLTRVSFPIFVAVLATALWIDGIRDGATWKRIAYALALAACLAAPWYLFHAAGILRYFVEREVNPDWALHTGMPEFSTLANLLFYLRGIRNMISLPFIALGAMGLLLMLKRRSRGGGLVISGLLIMYGVLTILPGKSVRFVTPFLFLIAMPVAGIIDAMQTPFRRGAVGALILLLACSRMLCMNGVVPDAGGRGDRVLSEVAPMADDWSIGDILDDALRAKHGIGVLRIAVVPFLGHFRHDAFAQIATERDIRLRRESEWLIRGDAWEAELSRAEFLVTKSGSNGPELYSPHGVAVDRWLAGPEGSAFSVVGCYALPDGTEAILHQQEVSASQAWRMLPEGAGRTNVVAQFGDAIVLRAVESWREGGQLAVRCEWESMGRPKQDYRFFVQFRKGMRNAITKSFTPAAGALPTGVWTPGLRLIETYHIPLPQDDDTYESWIGWHRGLMRLPIQQAHAPIFWRALALRSTLLLSGNAPACDSSKDTIVPQI